MYLAHSSWVVTTRESRGVPELHDPGLQDNKDRVHIGSHLLGHSPVNQKDSDPQIYSPLGIVSFIPFFCHRHIRRVPPDKAQLCGLTDS